MQTMSRVDELFGEPVRSLRLLIAGGQRDTVIADALMVTFGHVAEQYLRGKNSFRFTFSVGQPGLRTVERMEEIRRHLGELFGHQNVSVHRDDSYWLGIIISVAL
jgi:hypothetical protein